MIELSHFDLSSIITDSLDKSLPSDPELLDFGQYRTVLSKKWKELGYNHHFQTLTWELFDMEMFYKRGSHAAHTDEKILYHAVGPNKEDKFKSYGDWFLTPECSFYKEMNDTV